MSCIALLTDFGLSDPYVGQIKGVFSQLCPEVPVIDISHDIKPFHIMQAGFLLAASRMYFPEKTVFVAVVDPGVGTDRKILVLESRKQLFLAPDNGLISLVLKQQPIQKTWTLLPGTSLPHTTATFHGRDIFGPAGAKLATGLAPEHLCEPCDPDTITCADWAEPTIKESSIAATILHIDRFGNIITNIPESTSLPDRDLQCIIGTHTFALSRAMTYADIPKDSVGILRGSQNFWEIASNQSSAAAFVGCNLEDPLKLQW